MINFFESVLQHPNYFRQFKCNDTLITAFNCPLEARLVKTKFAKLWTQYNYLFYVVDGRKIWHTAEGAYDIQQNSCLFVRKGPFMLEQLSEGFCVILFFIPDDFICRTLQSRLPVVEKKNKNHKQVISIQPSELLVSFFLSMSAYFNSTKEPDPSLLELKFKELILTIVDNQDNAELLSYFCSLAHEPKSVAFQRIMNENYCFNFSMSEFAALTGRSLSAFKRDFQQIFKTTPGRWLLEKRLLHARNLLSHMNKNIGETISESGFESAAHFSRAFKQRFGVAPSLARVSLPPTPPSTPPSDSQSPPSVTLK